MDRLFEFKHSQDHHLIPLINAIPLHSLSDPILEAQDLLHKNFRSFDDNEHILILGLGMGYHVTELLKKYYKRQQPQIFIIEPLKIVCEACLEYHSEIISQNITIIDSMPVHDLYQQNTFIDFLIQRPLILSHPPSLQLHKNYFKKLFTYKASPYLSQDNALLTLPSLKEYFSAFSNKTEFKDLPLKNKTPETCDLLIHALNSLVEQRSFQ